MKNWTIFSFPVLLLIFCLGMVWFACESDDDDDDNQSSGNSDKMPKAKFCNQITRSDGTPIRITLEVGSIVFENVKSGTCSECQPVPTGLTEITAIVDDESHDLGTEDLPTYGQYPEYTFVNDMEYDQIVVLLYGYECDVDPFDE